MSDFPVIQVFDHSHKGFYFLYILDAICLQTAGRVNCEGVKDAIYIGDIAAVDASGDDNAPLYFLYLRGGTAPVKGLSSSTWRGLAPLIKQYQLAGIFIRCFRCEIIIVAESLDYGEFDLPGIID